MRTPTTNLLDSLHQETRLQARLTNAAADAAAAANDAAAAAANLRALAAVTEHAATIIAAFNQPGVSAAETVLDLLGGPQGATQSAEPAEPAEPEPTSQPALSRAFRDVLDAAQDALRAEPTPEHLAAYASAYRRAMSAVTEATDQPDQPVAAEHGPQDATADDVIAGTARYADTPGGRADAATLHADQADHADQASTGQASTGPSPATIALANLHALANDANIAKRSGTPSQPPTTPAAQAERLAHLADAATVAATHAALCDLAAVVCRLAWFAGHPDPEEAACRVLARLIPQVRDRALAYRTDQLAREPYASRHIAVVTDALAAAEAAIRPGTSH